MAPAESPTSDQAQASATALSQPQLSSHAVGDVRKRKYAPKVKTGCTTCRVRRVKCDETKPNCKRCLTLGHVCTGINYGDAASKRTIKSTLISERLPTSREVSAARLYARRIAAETTVALSKLDIEPFGWDFAEACEYFNRVVHVRRCSMQLIPNDFHHTTDPSDSPVYPDPGSMFSIITLSVAHRIAAVSRMHGKPGTRQDQLSSLSHLWATFYRNLSDTLKALNTELERQRPMYIPRALFKIVDILSSEFYLVSTHWRAHIDGFVTLTQIGGGVDKIMSDLPMARLAFYYVMVVSITASATSPSHDQVVGASYFTTANIRDIYSTTIYPSLLCPTYLFLDIARINALRARKAEGLTVADHNVEDVLNHIDSFSPETWVESYPIPDNPECNGGWIR